MCSLRLGLKCKQEEYAKSKPNRIKYERCEILSKQNFKILTVCDASKQRNRPFLYTAPVLKKPL